MNKNLAFVLLVLVYCVLLLRLANRDFYYDEVTTLNNYVYQTGPYGSLNDHFCFSMVVKGWTSFLHIPLQKVLEHPWIIRLPLIAIPIATAVFMYSISGTLPIILLWTTIPYYYYAVAVRGYALSILLLTMFIWAVVRSRKVMTILSAAVFCYVMPTNMIFLAAALPWVWFYYGRETVRDAIYGFILGAGLYIPIMHAMVSDPQINVSNAVYHNLVELPWETLNSFVSYRWLLLPVAAYGLWETRYVGKYTVLATFVSTVAIAVFAMKGAYAWTRLMLPALPLWCLAVGEMLEMAGQRRITVSRNLSE